MKFDIPYTDEGGGQIIFEATGKPRMLVRFEDGRADKLVTDEDLARVRFGDNGEVTLEGDSPELRRVPADTTSEIAQPTAPVATAQVDDADPLASR